jgi:2-polyprenyl-3-methyl-5-hydroxy-6-metoxy-1,4-benzoquinol methylase
MGYDERERRRLALEASIQNPLTEQRLRRAGVASGMHVLDLGCGVGDVSMIAARLEERYGRVTAVDTDESALENARHRAQQQGLDNIAFLCNDCHSFQPDSAFDAVIGRHILIHASNPLSLLQNRFHF